MKRDPAFAGLHERLPGLLAKARKFYETDNPNGGISDLDMERAKRLRRQAIGKAATAWFDPTGGEIGGMIGYNWGPMQDKWKSSDVGKGLSSVGNSIKKLF